jgi:hypothetical protein
LTLEKFDPHFVAQGIMHPCSLISRCATQAIFAGFGKTEAMKLIPTAFESNQRHTIWYGAAIAEAIVGSDSVKMCLSRLERPIYDAHACLFRVMARLADDAQRNFVTKSFFSWLIVDDSKLATDIAEYIREFDPLLNVDSIKELRRVLAHWTKSGSKCEEHDIPVKGGSCPICSTVPPSPRCAILRELHRLGDVNYEELNELCNDSRHDVSNWAKQTLIEQSAKDNAIRSANPPASRASYTLSKTLVGRRCA